MLIINLENLSPNIVLRNSSHPLITILNLICAFIDNAMGQILDFHKFFYTGLILNFIPKDLSCLFFKA